MSYYFGSLEVLLDSIHAEVREVYDVVGFDPRGVARSAPITCFTDEQMDGFLGNDPTPDDAQEEAESAQLMEEFATACAQAAPDLVGHISTVEAAKDMYVLRSALGEEELSYLGASYGTYLGATYASLFPENVGRFLLDGAIDPLPGTTEVFGLFDLVSHEFGHCLTVGHVGDGAEGSWGPVPTNDIMSYNEDPPGASKCVSSLDVEHEIYNGGRKT